MISNRSKHFFIKKMNLKFHSIGFVILCFFFLCLFLVSGSAFAGGLTIVTHGFNSNSNGWLDFMGLNIGYRIIDETWATEGVEPAAIPFAIYELKITSEAGGVSNYEYNGNVPSSELPIYPTIYNPLIFTHLYWGVRSVNGISMENSKNGEGIILVDWSDLDSFIGIDLISDVDPYASVRDVAYVVRDVLNNLRSILGYNPIAVPIHLIGHSRGGSLVGVLAKYLSEWNLWVDQVTFLDPHPLNLDYGYFFGINVSDNVRFADNYWRKGGINIPNGEEISGAANIQLNDEFLEGDLYGGYSGLFKDRHADVHLWYHGTIDIKDGITDGEASVSSSPINEINEWYDVDNSMPSPRTKTGYYYSRIVGGNRTSDGLANTNNREFVPKTLNHIANLDSNLSFDSTSTVTIGNNLLVDFRYQAIENCEISLGFDSDPNPFNGNEIFTTIILSAPPTSNGTVFDNGTGVNDYPVETSSIPAGKYYIIAKITGSNGFTRYVSSSKMITLVPEEPPPGPDPDFNEPNNSPEQATDLGVASGEELYQGSQENVKITAGDVDYYKFEILSTGTSDDEVVVYLPTIGTGSGDSDIDLAIGRFNNSGNFVPADSSWYKSSSLTDTRHEAVSLEGYKPGVYYAIVFGASGYDPGEDNPDFIGTEECDYRLLITGPLPTVISPVINPTGGTFTSSTIVSLSCATPNAEIRYTVDGTTPTISSTLYQLPFTINSTGTVRARAFKNGYNDSPIVEASFTINYLPELSVTPASREVAFDADSTMFQVVNIGNGTMSWTASVTSGGDWLSITSESSGTDSGTITVGISANTTTASRSGTISITASGAVNSPTDITLVQKGSLAGDVNSDGVVNLVDAILPLQILTQTDVQSTISLAGDTNNDHKIDLAETIYSLRSVAGLILPEGTVLSAGQIWMDRNLGASRVATSVDDSEAYGDLYQYGRGTDGHEKRTSLTVNTQSSEDVPGHSNFIIGFTDWQTPHNADLWQGVSGTNNPCPTGFRIPTEAEWEIELASWSSENNTGAFNSPLKLVAAGYRWGQGDGAITVDGTTGAYWSSTDNGNGGRLFYFFNTSAGTGYDEPINGFSVRCIKD